MKEKIGFIGLGLIGGSIAKAIRQYYPDFELVAFDKQKETLALAARKASSTPHVLRSTTAFATAHICFYVLLSPITMPIWHN